MMMFLYAVTYLVFTGTGIWGINIPVGWGFDIVNFVWWIGIGHAGTLISAILLLFRQQWRTSINRFAEAMTIFAVACAGIFPVLHMGRPWLAYWLFPYPNTMASGRSSAARLSGMCSRYRPTRGCRCCSGTWASSRLRDAAGSVATQFRASASTASSRSGGGFRRMHWHRYETAYLLLAGLATPLVVSVHTVVSFDFAVSVVPAGTRRFSRPTSSRARSIPGSRWC